MSALALAGPKVKSAVKALVSRAGRPRIDLRGLWMYVALAVAVTNGTWDLVSSEGIMGRRRRATGNVGFPCAGLVTVGSKAVTSCSKSGKNSSIVTNECEGEKGRNLHHTLNMPRHILIGT